MEHEFHEWLRSQCKDHPFSWIRQGIGDDAAVIATDLLRDGAEAAFDLVVSSDMIAEGTHFLNPDNDPVSLKKVGRKLVAVNFSDIAAMGATPKFITLNFLLPKALDVEHVILIFEGARKLTQQYDVAIIGGDTNTWQGPIVLSATVTGIRDADQTGWGLDDAQVGDAIFASGSFGGSIFGRHQTFEPRIELANYLAKNYSIHAATDATDSLTIDLMAIAKASRVAIQLDLDSIPISKDVQASEESESAALLHALHDGEDFELLFTVSPEIADRLIIDPNLPTPVTRIGKVVDGSARLIDQDGNLLQIAGYIH